MRKKSCLILFCFTFLFFPVFLVKADNPGGTGGGSGSLGGPGGGGARVLHDSGASVESGVYKFELVYKPKDKSNRTIIKCAVIDTSKRRGLSNRSKLKIKSLAQDYARNHGCVYKDSGDMVNLAKRLNNNSETVDSIFGKSGLKEERVIRSYFEEFKVTENDLQEPHDYNTGHYNSYGYRILIQRFIPFMKNGSIAALKTRKEFANENPSPIPTQLFGTSRSFDLHTTKGDIGIASAAGTDVGDPWQSADELFAKFKNWYNGAGYNILWLAVKTAPKVDFSVDAACENCENEDDSDDGKAYVIQDTTNWEGILRSEDKNYMCATSKKTAEENTRTTEEYFINRTSCGNVYCREEVQVIFPNEKDGSVLTTERGRYFTVHTPFRNTSGENEGKVKDKSPYYYLDEWTDDVDILNNLKSYGANFGEIKVMKIRECRMKGKTKVEEEKCMSSQENLKFHTPTGKDYKSSGNDFKITLEYNGKLNDGTNEKIRYELGPESLGEFGNGTTSTLSYYDNDKFESKDKQIQSNGVYVHTQTTAYKLPGIVNRYIEKDGGVFVSKKPISQNYIDLGIATVPVSQDNIVLTSEDATLTLSFELSKDLHLKNAFEERIELPNCGSDSSIDTIANIYQYVWKKYKITIDKVSGMNSTDEKEKIKELSNSACAKLYNCSETKDGISCTKKGINECIEQRRTKKSGNCLSNSQEDSSNYICSVYVDPGIPNIPELPEEECPGCREEVEKEPNCIFELGSNVCIPATGYNKLIYRPIDLTSPFPAQDGSGRKTGANWCGYDTQLKKYSCSNENPVVDEYILNNRGVKGEDVYSLNPMYEVELTPEKIKEIQAYNRGKSYDNFTLTCETDGTRCEMTIQGTLGVDTNCDIDRSDPKCEKQYKSGGGS